MSRRVVLVVEDEPVARETLLEVIADEGYPVAAAGNGREALAWLRGNPAPALVLLDLMMPDLDGRGFLAALADDPGLATLEVVVLSAGSDVELADVARSTGRRVLGKPVDLEDLLGVIAGACGRSFRPGDALDAGDGGPTPRG